MVVMLQYSKSKQLSSNRYKNTDHTLDALWSEAVKLLANNRCEYCGTRSYIQAHHIFTRKNKSSRWEVCNGIALCMEHHTMGDFSAHRSPNKFQEWIRVYRPNDFTASQSMAKSVRKFTDSDRQVVMTNLRTVIEQYEGIRK